MKNFKVFFRASVTIIYFFLINSFARAAYLPGDVLLSGNANLNPLEVNVSEAFTWLHPDSDGITSVQVQLPVGTDLLGTYNSIPFDITPFRGMQVQFECDLKAEGITVPNANWKGGACILAFDSTQDGTQYSSFSSVWGTFDWTTFKTIISISPDARNGKFILGLQGVSGKAKVKDWKLRLVRSAPTRPDVDPTWMPNRTNPMRGFNLGSFNNANVSDLAALRANIFRLSIGATQSVASNPVLYEQWLSERLVDVEVALAEARLRNLKLVINLHVTPGGRRADSSNAMFYNAALQNQFVAVWKKIATRFKGNSSIYAYDLVNEPVQEGFVPKGLLDWRNLQARAAAEIRAIDPITPISIQVDNYDGPDNFKWLDPIDLPGIIYSVHMYKPMNFTHQGQAKKFGVARSLNYPGIFSNGVVFNKNTLRAYLQPVRDFQMANKAKIWVGEFSSVRWAPGAAQYLTDLTAIFEEWSWDWTYHSFREWPGWSLEAENLPVPENINSQIPAVLPTDRMKAIQFWLNRNP